MKGYSCITCYNMLGLIQSIMVTIMNLSIWINDRLLKALEITVKETGKKKNAVIAEALTEYLTKRRHQEWPKDIQNFKGIKGFESADRFEKSRSELKNLRDDIFEDKR